MTDATVKGAQKLAGIAAKDMVKISALTVIGRITGVIGIGENLLKYKQTGDVKYFFKAAGQAVAIGVGYATGVEEIEMIYNLGMLGYDIYEMKKN